MIKARSRRPISGQTTPVTSCEPTVHLYNISSHLKIVFLKLIFQIWKLYVSVNLWATFYIPRSWMMNPVVVCWQDICAFQVEAPSRDVNGSTRSQAPPVPAPPIPDRASRTSTASSFDHNVSAHSSSYATKLSFQSPVTAYERSLQKVTIGNTYLHTMYMYVHVYRYMTQHSTLKIMFFPTFSQREAESNSEPVALHRHDPDCQNRPFLRNVKRIVWDDKRHSNGILTRIHAAKHSRRLKIFVSNYLFRWKIFKMNPDLLGAFMKNKCS